MKESEQDPMGERGLQAMAARLRRSRSAATVSDVASSPRDTETTETEPALAGPWQKQVDAAKVTWDKLSVAELQRCEGIEHRLIALVQQRYAISRLRATREVKTFFQEQSS